MTIAVSTAVCCLQFITISRIGVHPVVREEESVHVRKEGANIPSRPGKPPKQVYTGTPVRLALKPQPVPSRCRLHRCPSHPDGARSRRGRIHRRPSRYRILGCVVLRLMDLKACRSLRTRLNTYWKCAPKTERYPLVVEVSIRIGSNSESLRTIAGKKPQRQATDTVVLTLCCLDDVRVDAHHDRNLHRPIRHRGHSHRYLHRLAFRHSVARRAVRHSHERHLHGVRPRPSPRRVHRPYLETVKYAMVYGRRLCRR